MMRTLVASMTAALLVLLLLMVVDVPQTTTAASRWAEDTPARSVGLLALNVDAPQAINTDFGLGAHTWSIEQSGPASDTIDFIGLNWICDPTEVDARMNVHKLSEAQVARLQRVAIGALRGDPRYQYEICWAGIEFDIETHESRWTTGT